MTNSRAERAVFTIAVGSATYHEMAFALARSFLLWHRDSDIRFVLVSDIDERTIPADLREIELQHVASGALGAGFAPKLALDRLAPASRSLFIDADCLCVARLDHAFDAFAGRPVSVVGREICGGTWAGVYVADVARRFAVSGLTRFNGGVYYLEPGPRCSAIYETARRLLPDYDAIGFERLRGRENDEPLLSLAMAIHGACPVDERGDIMNSLLAAPGGLEIDVFKGRALLRNPKSHPRHNQWYRMEQMRPPLVHFLGADPRSYPYRREVERLRLVGERRWPRRLATAWVALTSSAPSIAARWLKDRLRPAYHVAFGPRPVRGSARF